MEFSAYVRQTGEVSIVSVSGRLTSFANSALGQTISELVQKGHKKILLELSGLTYLDSSGIGELVRNYVMVAKNNGEMKVVGLTPRVEELLKITQLYKVLHEFNDEPSALRSFLPLSKSKTAE